MRAKHARFPQDPEGCVRTCAQALWHSRHCGLVNITRDLSVLAYTRQAISRLLQGLIAGKGGTPTAPASARSDWLVLSTTCPAASLRYTCTSKVKWAGDRQSPLGSHEQAQTHMVTL